jgi:hypothetical protein
MFNDQEEGPTRAVSEAPTNPKIKLRQDVTIEKVTETLKNLPKGKVLGSDGIPNEVLKALNPEIAEGLTRAISGAFASGTLPDQYKKSVTIVIRKKSKKDYSLPGNYRLIALKNTLVKVVKKILATRLSRAAEEHGLLP